MAYCRDRTAAEEGPLERTIRRHKRKAQRAGVSRAPTGAEVAPTAETVAEGEGRPSMAATTLARRALAPRAAAGLSAPATQQNRRYNSRDQLDRHLVNLTDLAHTVQPAHKSGNFLRRAKVVCTIGPKVANEADIGMLMAGMSAFLSTLPCKIYTVWYDVSYRERTPLSGHERSEVQLFAR